MTEQMTATPSADGRLLQLADGDLLLVLAVEASPGAVEAAHRSAIERFRSLRDEIAAERALIDRPALFERTDLAGGIARRMWRAVRPFAADHPVPPRVAMHGSIAEEILSAAAAAAVLDRAVVGCGGSIALLLTPGFGYRAAFGDAAPASSQIAGADIRATDMARGVAQEGLPGGGAVMVLAQTAAKAGAAASRIAATGATGSDGDIEAAKTLAGDLLRRGLVTGCMFATAAGAVAIGSISPVSIERAAAGFRRGRGGLARSPPNILLDKT